MTLHVRGWVSHFITHAPASPQTHYLFNVYLIRHFLFFI